MKNENEQTKNKIQVIKAKLCEIRKKAKYVKLLDDKVFEQAFLILSGLFLTGYDINYLYRQATRLGTANFDISNINSLDWGISTTLFVWVGVITMLAATLKNNMKKNIQSRMEQAKQNQGR